MVRENRPPPLCRPTPAKGEMPLIESARGNRQEIRCYGSEDFSNCMGVILRGNGDYRGEIERSVLDFIHRVCRVFHLPVKARRADET